MRITISDDEDSQHQVEIGPPDECPVCHRHIEAKFLELVIYNPGFANPHELQVVFQCPSHTCQSVFIAYYARLGLPGPFAFGGCRPFSPQCDECSAEIKQLSPGFCEIFQQAQIADAMGLHQICGLGYRKALEFLLKDYAISVEQAQADEIKASHRLVGKGSILNAYITDRRIQAVGERAVWLGNDEAHYDRRWEDKDVGDLKRLLAATVHWIEIALTTDQYTKDMPNPGS